MHQQVPQTVGPPQGPGGPHQVVSNKPVHINKDTDDKDTGEIMPHGPSFDAGVTKWKCNKCQKLFKTRAYLRKHRRNHDERPDQPSAPLVPPNPTSSAFGGGPVTGEGDKWSCNVCMMRFATQNLLREHRKLHRKVKMPRPRPYPDVPHVPVPHVVPVVPHVLPLVPGDVVKPKNHL